MNPKLLKRKAILGIAFLIPPLMMNACSQSNGTEGGNPFASTATITMKVGPNNNSNVNNLSLCVEQVHFLPMNSSAATEVIPIQTGEIIVGAEDANLGSMILTKQAYQRIEVVLGAACLSQKSAKFTNTNGNFSASQTLTVRFDGQFTISNSSRSVTLTTAAIINELESVSANEQLKTAIETAAGGIQVQDMYGWIGGGNDAKWTTPANWFGGSVPTETDTAVFDSNCVTNCSALINAPITVKGIRIASGYTGTLTQAAGQSITLGKDGWFQVAGIFQGGDSDILLTSANFNLGGGTFTSTGGTLSIRYSKVYEDPFSKKMAQFYGGSFLHNNGWLVVGVDDVHLCTGATGSITVFGGFNLVLNNLEISSQNPGCQPSNLEFSGTGTINVVGDLLHLQNSLDGSLQIQLQGNLEVGAAAVGGRGKILLNGTAAQTYSDHGGATAQISIDKTAGTVAAASGTTSLTVSSLSVIQGSFTAPSGNLTLYQDITDVPDSISLEVASGANFNPNFGSLILDGRDGSCLGGHNLTIDVPSGFILNHMIVKAEACQPNSVSLIPGRTLIVGGQFSHLKTGTDSGLGLNNGTWEIRGDAVFKSPVQGSAAISFTGTANQTVSRTGSGLFPAGSVAISKASGSVSLGSNLALSYPGQSLSLTGNSTLNLAGKSLSVNGTLNIATGTTLKLSGGSHSQGVLVNNGSIVP